ncbi:MAG: aminotransferase [Myxococcales bacterium]|nr:aminotransferase [Myxococcales bacterium]
MPGKVWIEGFVVDADAARVPVFDRGFLYGDSVYEVMRTFGGRPFALGEHLERLARSAALLEIALPDRALIEQATVAVMEASQEKEVYVRIVVTRGSGPIGLDPAFADAPRLVVMALPLKVPDSALYRDGVAVALVGARRSSLGAPGAVDPQAKSGNYLNSVLAVAEARRKSAYEAVLCDAVGRLAEGASSNIFVVRIGRLQTPPLSVGLLEGITRRHVIACARSLAIPVDEVALWPVDLQRADEAFLTSSVRGVMPVVRVDGAVVGEGQPGPITRRISDAYLADAQRG